MCRILTQNNVKYGYESKHTQNSESQQQVVGVAAAVACIFICNVCVVISLAFFFLLLVCVGLVGFRLVRHPVCGDSGRVCASTSLHMQACKVFSVG